MDKSLSPVCHRAAASKSSVASSGQHRNRGPRKTAPKCYDPCYKASQKRPLFINTRTRTAPRGPQAQQPEASRKHHPGDPAAGIGSSVAPRRPRNGQPVGPPSKMFHRRLCSSQRTSRIGRCHASSPVGVALLRLVEEAVTQKGAAPPRSWGFRLSATLGWT